MAIPQAALAREVLTLNNGWRFHEGDIGFPKAITHSETYKAAKAGNARGPASFDFDDTGWRQVDLPHDWVVAQPFESTANIPQGYRKRGIGWYRRHFHLDRADEGKHLEIRFDGVATHCTVWFNGTLVARNFCGYTSFAFDATPLARYGDQVNTLAVRVDADEFEGWWYEGGGIYRHTWLVKRAPLHIASDGIHADPQRREDGSWVLPVAVTCHNAGDQHAAAELEVELIDPMGREVAHASASVALDPLSSGEAGVEIPVDSPALWSVDSPALYQVRVKLSDAGGTLDTDAVKCGFRTLRFDAKRGFFLNDRPLKIQGVCNHQDHAGVGVAVPDALWDFRVRRMKEMGANAWRCAHHPPAKEFLDACDRLGMLVMNENRNFNTSEDGIRQLEWMVRRDRNHPSVFMWSVFNEEPMQETRQGYEMARRMVAAVRRLDANRPVTAAMNGGHLTARNVSHAVDVVGFNYCMQDYDRFHAARPDTPMLSSEDTSGLMTRGEYADDPARGILAAYDEKSAGWGGRHRETWRVINERAFVAGGFVWTGFDYRGEPTPFTWPNAASSFGCVDQCGFPKTAYYIRRAQWEKNQPVLHLVPHWNWPGREGEAVKVLACTNAQSVEFILNGESLGEMPVDRYEFAAREVIYQPGVLEAVARVDGRETARAKVETTGPAVALRLTPDRASLAGAGADAMPVTVEAVDAAGRPVPTANLPVDFAVSGAGALIGLGNGDPRSHECDKGTRRSLFNGLAQAIVQSDRGASGSLVLRASAAGLRPAELAIPVTAAQAPPAVGVARPVFTLLRWRMSPSSTERPADPLSPPADNDQNTWREIWPDQLRPFTDGDFAVFRIEFTPYHDIREQGGRVVFQNITGKATLWLDGVQVAVKDRFDPAPLGFEVPPRQGKRTLVMLVETRDRLPAGMDQAVTIEPKS